MSKITEVAVWEPTVYQWDVTDPNKAGPATFDNDGEATDGFANAGVQQVTNRTAYLKETLDSHIGSRGTAHTNATQTEAGFMSASDKTKLNGVETGAQVNAPPTVTIVNKTAAYTVVAGDLSKVINCTSGTFTVSLTAAATLGAGFNCWVWNTSITSTDVITVDPNASELIDGTSTLVLRRGEGMQVICDGASWSTGSKKRMRGYAENASTGVSRPVASGDRGIAIGTGNSGSVTAGSTDSFAAGNNSSGAGAVTATGGGAMALGGSYASGVDSFAAAISNNTSSYGATGANSVAIGRLARATTADSIALSYSAIASGVGAVAIGYQVTASGPYSLALGSNSVAAQHGKQAFASGQFSVAGDAQFGRRVLRGQSTSGSTRNLTADGALSPTATTTVTLPDDSTYIFKGQVVARNTATDNDSKCWEIKGAARRGAGASTIALIGTPVIDIIASDGSPWTLSVTVNTVDGSVYFSGIGEAGKTIRWVCTLDTTEVTG